MNVLQRSNLLPGARGAFLGLLLAVGCSTYVCAQTYGDFQAGVFRDTNLSRAKLDRDIKADNAISIEGHLGRAFELRENLSASITGEARAEQYAHYKGLNNVTLGTTLGLKHKLGIGLTAPIIRYHASLARLSFDDSYRTGWKTTAGASITKRFNEKWELSTSFSFDHRWTDKELRLPPFFSGAAYDVTGRTLSIDANYTASEKWLVSFGIAQRRGEIASTGVHTKAIWDASTAWSKDFALGDDSYRIDARTNMLNLAASYALSDRSSLNLSFARWLSRANGGFDYNNSIVRASFIYNFF
jgi:hypothetical protein